MRRDKIKVFIHIIWTTWDREPLILPQWEDELFGVVCEMVERHNGKMVKINGTTDHVHMLVKFASTTRLCDLVKDAKGTSSRFFNARVENFKWRPTYAAFSVSRWDVEPICRYIERQKEHHADGTADARLEVGE